MDLNFRLYSNNPVISPSTRMVKLVANAIAGTAEDLYGKFVPIFDAAYPAEKWALYHQRVVGLLISNPDADPAYLRLSTLTAAAAGEGIPLLPGDRIYLPWKGPPADPMLFESKGSLCITFITED